ncbi:amidohydrolase [Brevibacterium album]|uniref:amidohydrolase n=1 Tax=Brevibacterium album TaxID=417948 RepID=UPI000422E952|nr:amidohydrolase [Brevibacterium album]
MSTGLAALTPLARRGARASFTIRGARVFDGCARTSADTVTVEDGVVTGIGSGLAPVPGAPVVETAGRLVTPGFVDAHAHPVAAGVEALSLDLSGCDGRAETLEAVRRALSSGSGWLTGGGWTMSDFPGGVPTAAELDALDPAGARPVYLINADHHSAWVNTTAMRLAGIGRDTPAPPGGVIERDGDGEPVGTLHESAMDLVSAHLPAPADAELDAALVQAQHRLHALGITGWNDAIVGEYGGMSDALPVYLRAEAAGTLTMEVTCSLWWPRDVHDSEAAAQELAGHRFDRERLRTTNVKMMLDGIVESQTAAMSTPYCRCEQVTGAAEAATGTRYFSPAHLEEAFAAVQRAGFDVHCHAIGDRAVRDALDAFAALHAQSSGGPAADHRHHIAHIQVVDPADVPRFAQLGVSANLQALWAHFDEQMVELNLPVLGSERSGWQYPFGDLQRSGAHLAMGSDWPVSTPDPWQAIHVAVNRTHPTGARPEPLGPDQALDLSCALRAYTTGSAHLGRTRTAGRLAVGAAADLALASADPFALARTQIHTVRNLLTVAGGRLVHAAPSGRTTQ